MRWFQVKRWEILRREIAALEAVGIKEDGAEEKKKKRNKRKLVRGALRALWRSI